MMPVWVEIVKAVAELGFAITVALILLLGVMKRLNAIEIQNQKICDILESMDCNQKKMVDKLLGMVDRRIQ